ncbi:hypothetical protein [Nocardia nova]|uniref:hypothetical protein n=1 Tax=Nocardia nova TaxID=37330 RepID=UPI003408B7E9
MTVPARTPDPGESAPRLGERVALPSAGGQSTAPATAREPNTAQVALLRRLRDVSDGLNQMHETGRRGVEFGHFPSQLWSDYLAERQQRAGALTALGRAGGVASPWLEYARGATGEHVPDRWPAPDPAARASLIEDLARQARELREIAAVDAVYRPEAAGETQRTRDAYAEAMSQRWDRIATLAALLKPAGAEREQIWPPGNSSEVRELVTGLRASGRDELARRWHTHRVTVHPEVTTHSTLLDYGDLAWDRDATIVPTPGLMVAELTGVPSTGPDHAATGGAAIDADIAAALPDHSREFPADTSPTSGTDHGTVPALDLGHDP